MQINIFIRIKIVAHGYDTWEYIGMTIKHPIKNIKLFFETIVGGMAVRQKCEILARNIHCFYMSSY